MAKKKKSAKDGQHRISSTEWLENRLEGTMLDLDALNSMSADELQEELEAEGASSTKSFIASLNEKLPGNVEISVPSSASSAVKKRKRSTKRSDQLRERSSIKSQRNAIPAASLRLFSFRNALILSACIIIGAVAVPFIIFSLQNSSPQPAVVPIEPDTMDTQNDAPPTRIEGSFPDLMYRGVRYIIEGFDQVPIHTPLPPKPDTLQAAFSFRVTTNNEGFVESLESLQTQHLEFESVLIDSLLKWKFSTPERSAPDSAVGLITIRYSHE